MTIFQLIYTYAVSDASWVLFSRKKIRGLRSWAPAGGCTKETFVNKRFVARSMLLQYDVNGNWKQIYRE